VITDALLGLVTGVGGWVLSLFKIGRIEFLAGFDANLQKVLDLLSGLGVWVDWTVLLATVGVVLAVWTGGLIIKLVLRLISHVPEFGGKW
jgi:hypothetical protein